MKDLFNEKKVIKASLSSPRKQSPWKTIKVKNFIRKNNFTYQLTYSDGIQEWHKNFTPDVIYQEWGKLTRFFKQGEIFTEEKCLHLMWNKKGELHTKSSSQKTALFSLPHNREKNYFFLENTPYPFLIALNIQNKDGSIKPKKRDKFVQINHFLNLVLPYIKENSSIIDFGCGKGYLTFALYHALQDKGVKILGVDRKKEVIESLKNLASELDYKNLSFETGDIEAFVFEKAPDVLIALHACNTATDAALFQGIKLSIKTLFVAPCCHQEALSQIQSDALLPILRYGILKERFAALATDAIRAEILNQYGYDTHLLEFVDSEHTPKNLLIRAIKGKKKTTRSTKAFCQSLKLSPALATLLSSLPAELSEDGSAPLNPDHEE